LHIDSGVCVCGICLVAVNHTCSDFAALLDSNVSQDFHVSSLGQQLFCALPYSYKMCTVGHRCIQWSTGVYKWSESQGHM
jgi:Na+/H+ antiporter NhaB